MEGASGCDGRDDDLGNLVISRHAIANPHPRSSLMDRASSTPEPLCAAVVSALDASSDAKIGVFKKYESGAAALAMGGKFVAMLDRARLVVNSSRQRVGAIVAAGGGTRSTHGYGRGRRGVSPRQDED
jgi:hypothetical protein